MVFLFVIPLISSANYIDPLSIQGVTIENKLKAIFWDAPIMIEIARCESHLRQFDSKGNVLKGIVNPKDKGVFQISETYWLDVSNQLDYNIYAVNGNIQMARYIYDTQGTKPWNASKGCWSLSTLQKTKKIKES